MSFGVALFSLALVTVIGGTALAAWTWNRHIYETETQRMMRKLTAGLQQLGLTMAYHLTPAINKAAKAMVEFAAAWNRLPDDTKDEIRRMGQRNDR